MRIVILITLFSAFLFSSCSSQREDTSQANIYAPGNISTHMSERDAALSPDESMFLLSVQITRDHSAICYSTKFNGKWMRPRVASFSGHYMDIEPVFHPNGNLYFCSNRPMPGEEDAGDYNIWFVKPIKEGWSSPEALDTIINGPSNEFYPSFTSNGDLYFTSTLPTGIGREDIWVSKFINGKFIGPENLGESINTAQFEYNSFISPDGNFIMFTTNGRGEGFGSGDLYISFKDEEGNWQAPKNMGPKVNTKGFEYCPSLSPDGKTLFFTRKNIPSPEGEKWSYFEMMSSFNSLENGQGNIYYIDSDFIESLK